MTDAPTTSNAATSTLRRVALWMLVVAWAGVIFWFSTKPGTQIPGRFSEIGHLGEYFVFGVLLYSALRTDLTPARAAAIAIIVASCYGMSDEFHQHFVFMRTPDVVDWGTDTIGATVGMLVARGLGRFAKRQ